MSAYPWPPGCRSCAPRSRLGARAASGSRWTPTREVVPTLGSKEVVFSLAQVVCGRGDRVAVTDARLPGARARRPLRRARGRARCRCVPSAGGCPTSTRVDWTACALLWLNFPNNPTGARRAAGSLRAGRGARARARVRPRLRRGLLRAVVRRRGARVGARGAPTGAGSLVLNTLSKRSSMPGYRSGFVAGDADVIAALKRFRPNTGARRRRSCSAPRSPPGTTRPTSRRSARATAPSASRCCPRCEAAGLEPAGGPGSFFLWLRVARPTGPGRRRGAALALLDDHGLVAGARLVPRAGRRGAPAPRARAHAGAVRRGGAAPGRRARRLAVGVQRGVQAAPAPGARDRPRRRRRRCCAGRAGPRTRRARGP